MLKIVFSIIIVLLSCMANAGSDSLLRVYSKMPHDTNTINIVIKEAKSMRSQGQYNDAKKILRSIEKWVLKSKFTKHIGIWYNGIGLVYDYEGNSDSAIIQLQKAIPYFQSIDDHKNEATTYLNIAIAYMYKAQNAIALEYFIKGLKISEKYNYQNLTNTIYMNIGGVYFNLGNLRKAKYYFDMRIEAGDDAAPGILASCYYNLGMIYFKWNNLDSSEINLLKALSNYEELKDYIGIADAKAGLGAIKRQQGNYEASKKYYDDAMRIMHNFDAPISPEIYLNASILYAFKNDKKRAFAYSDTARKMIEKLNSREKMAEFYHSRAMMQSQFGLYKGAYDDLYNYTLINDSVFSDENTQAIEDLKIEYDKKKEADSIRLREKIKREEQTNRLKAEAIEQDKRNKTILVGVISFSVLIIIFAVIIFRRFQVTQKQNKIIELQKREVIHQKEIVEDKNKEIVDSINYAKRLQEAILPSDKFWFDVLPQSFILYKPKDIVAGDFYWLDVVNDNGKRNILFAAADCTGHGVPGALVSVVCSNALNRSVNEFGLTGPGQILDKTTDLVIETFIKNGNEVKDGMDISICNLKMNNGEYSELEWAGANNSLWLFRNHELMEYKADKQPVGIYFERKKFTTHTIQLQKNDSLYIFSDGYADQFGGERKKKYKESALKKFIAEIVHLPMKEQVTKLENEFNGWKGNMEQIDDVCIIGVKI